MARKILRSPFPPQKEATERLRSPTSSGGIQKVESRLARLVACHSSRFPEQYLAGWSSLRLVRFIEADDNSSDEYGSSYQH